ncbi:MAG: hypothetical protein JW809_19890 [Pirellulales bacterium]|nr:hypothetical protein [Pirellulales bacterium]
MVDNARLARWAWTGVVVVCLGAALIWTLAYAVDGPPDEATATVKTFAYTLRQARAADVQGSIAALLPDSTDVRVDESTNRLVIRGTPQAHELARAAMDALDRVAVRPAALPSESAGSLLRAYPCPAGRAAAEETRLRQQFPQEGVRIAADPRSGQILVLAPAAVQAQVARRMGGVAGPSELAAAPAPMAASPATGPIGPESHIIPLQNSRAGQVEAALVGMLPGRVRAVPGSTGQRAHYQLAVPGGVIDLAFDRSTNEVTVRGAGRALESCIRLVRGLDQTVSSREPGARFVSLGATTPTALQRTIAAVAQAGAAQPPSEEGQPPAPLTPAVPPEEPPAEAGGALIGSVRVEMLEGLDVLVIRGHQRDVERVIEIIDEIERLSAETEPAIEVYQLAHVDCTALSELVQQLYGQVFSPRQGTVSITALVKPNAILLVGRAESVATVVDLIKRLDQPVAPETQFRVFALRHAPAENARAQIETFYEERGVLGTKVLVTADYRSNSLIVQAAPRDMMELAELIGRIDTPTSAAINELRVFHLENSMASDLAPILQDAVAAQADETGARRAAGGPEGAAGASAQSSGQKSTMLRFLTVDRAGQRQLNSGILTDVRITADTRANALLVSAPADSMELLAALIEQLDKLPAVEAQIKVFTIVNGDASSLIELLQTLFAQEQQRQAAAGPAVNTGAREGESSLVSLRFGVDIRTNSIIASGNAGDLSVVEAILLRLDNDDVRNRQSSVRRLLNAYAPDVATAINEYLRSERQQVEQAAPGLYSAFEQIEREVVVVSEPVSNSLIISATPRFYKEIDDLITKLDERPPMVMIQVLIAEVKLNNVDEFGIELGLQDSLLFDRSLLSELITTTNTKQTSTAAGIITETEEIIQGADNVPGFNFNNQPLGNSGSTKAMNNSNLVGGQGLSSFGVGRINNELGYGGMVLSASSESVSILIRALRQCGRLDILSRPQIMTLNNQLASIQVGQRVSLIRGTAVNEAGQTNQVNPEDIGLILRVTPRISPDGLVVMEVLAEKSSLGPESEGTPVSISATGEPIRQPPINTTTAETVVAALNGQTVVLGGLITKEKDQVHRRVPFLSDIPILGRLFRYDYESDIRTELLIIMTPHIVKTEGDAEAVKQMEVARMHWCLCDVVDVHGDGGLRGRFDDWSNAETHVVHPDMQDQGEVIPAPEGMPGPLQPIPQRPELGPAPGPPSSHWIPRPTPAASPPTAAMGEPTAAMQPIPSWGLPPEPIRPDPRISRAIPPAPASVDASGAVAPATWYPPRTPPAAGSSGVQPAAYGAPVVQPVPPPPATWQYR